MYYMKLQHQILFMIAAAMLSGCGPDNAPLDPPANFSANAGESMAVLDWDLVDGNEYWVFYKAGTTVSLDDYDKILNNASNPAFVTGLDNGTQYALAIAASSGTSPVGPFSPVLTVTPRLLGPTVPWTVATPLTTDMLNDIAYALNSYVAVGDNLALFVGDYEYLATEPVYGTAGISNWTQPTLPLSGGNLVSVIHDGNRFVALADSGEVIITTDDNQTWAAATAINTTGVMRGLTAGPGLYVAVGDGGVIFTNSNDGVSADWSAQNAGVSDNLVAVNHVNGRYFALGENGVLLSSVDGIDWTEQTTNTVNTLRQIAASTDRYVVVGDTGTVLDSTDASNWTLQNAPTAESLRDIVFGDDDQFIAVGTNGSVAYSASGTDGSWALANEGSIDLNSIARNRVFIAVGAAGANISGK